MRKDASQAALHTRGRTAERKRAARAALKRHGTHHAFVSGFDGFNGDSFATRYGSSIESSDRLKAMRDRESFLLNCIIPRHRTWRDAFTDWGKRSRKAEVCVPLLLVTALYVGTAAGCSFSARDGGICAGGPLDDDGNALSYLSFGEDYGPPILNSLATLMLSFFANLCLGLYKDAYEACQQLKAAVADLMIIVGGTIHPLDDSMTESRRGVRMEFWRAANLFHVCTYVLADKTRDTYNFDNFLVPVALAFGDFDGASRLGMLRLEELRMLAATPDAQAAQLGLQGSGGQGSGGLGSGGALASQPRPAAAAAASSRAGEDEEDDDDTALFDEPSARCSVRGRDSMVDPAGNPHSLGFANLRGDVRSRTAALHSALAVRLYALCEFVLDQRLSTASWPAWNALLMSVLRASETVKQKALFRLPRVYRYAVHFLVTSAIVTDTFILGARSGRLIAHASLHPEWYTFASFGSTLLLCINVLAAYFVLMLVQALSMMEQPFGSDMLDMPGLSYVCAAADTSLRTIACRPAASHGTRKSVADDGGGTFGGDESPPPNSRHNNRNHNIRHNNGAAASHTGPWAPVVGAGSEGVNIMELLQHIDENELIHDADGGKPRVRRRRQEGRGRLRGSRAERDARETGDVEAEAE